MTATLTSVTPFGFDVVVDGRAREPAARPFLPGVETRLQQRYRRLQRAAFRSTLHADRVEAYVAAHAAPNSELRQALADVGIRNYSIFLDEGRVFGYFEADDVDAANAALGRLAVMERWREAMSPLLDGTVPLAAASGDLPRRLRSLRASVCITAGGQG